MKCPNCGTRNPAGLRFCEQCATPLPREEPQAIQACPNCGAENRAGLRFCEQCAAPLVTTPPPEVEVKPAPAATLACPSCGAENRAGLRFCEQCAAPLVTAPLPRIEAKPAAAPKRGIPGRLQSLRDFINARAWLRIPFRLGVALLAFVLVLRIAVNVIDYAQYRARALPKITQDEALEAANEIVTQMDPDLAAVSPAVEETAFGANLGYRMTYEDDSVFEGEDGPIQVKSRIDVNIDAVTQDMVVAVSQ